MSYTTDPNDPRLGHGPNTEPTGQNEAYLILSRKERKKGFVRPLYRSYRHLDPQCNGVTTMGLELCETYARDPGFYGSTYCAKCRMHRPVGTYGEFVWLDSVGDSTGVLVGTLR